MNRDQATLEIMAILCRNDPKPFYLRNIKGCDYCLQITQVDAKTCPYQLRKQDSLWNECLINQYTLEELI
jgi:hypothetical protein